MLLFDKVIQKAHTYQHNLQKSGTLSHTYAKMTSEQTQNATLHTPAYKPDRIFTLWFNAYFSLAHNSNSFNTYGPYLHYKINCFSMSGKYNALFTQHT